jgi:hypothetical protein
MKLKTTCSLDGKKSEEKENDAKFILPDAVILINIGFLTNV